MKKVVIPLVLVFIAIYLIKRIVVVVIKWLCLNEYDVLLDLT